MNDQNKNSIFSTILVFIIGIIGLCLLLGFISGNGFGMNTGMMGESDMMGGRQSAGYSFGLTLTGLLALIIKLFTVALVIAFIVGAIIWLKDLFLINFRFSLKGLAENDPIMKIIVYGSLMILGLALVLALFGRYSYTNLSMNNGMSAFYYTQSYGFAGLISLLIKLFTFILIASLAIAAVVYLKNQFDQVSHSTQQNPGSTITPVSPGMEAKDLTEIKISGEVAGETKIGKRDK